MKSVKNRNSGLRNLAARAISPIVSLTFGSLLLFVSSSSTCSAEPAQGSNDGASSKAMKSSSGPIDFSTKAIKEETRDYPYEEDMLLAVNLRVQEMRDAKHVIEVTRDKRKVVLFDKTANVRLTYKSSFSGHHSPDLAALLAMAKLYPHSRLVLTNLSNGYEGQRNWAKAIETRERAEKESDSAIMWSLYTPAQKRQAELDGQAGFLSKRGYFECMMGKFDLAISDLTKAIALKPLYQLNYRNRMMAYEHIGRQAEADKDKRKLEQLLTSKTAQFSVFSEPAYTASRINDEVWAEQSFEEGIAAMSSLIKKYPDFCDLYLHRAVYYLSIGQYKKAVQDYDVVVHKSPAKVYLDERQNALDLLKNGAPPYGDLSKIKKQEQYEVAAGKKVSCLELARSHAGDLRVYANIFRGEVEAQNQLAAKIEARKIMHLCPPRHRFTGAFLYLENQEDADIIKVCSDYLDQTDYGTYEFVSLAYLSRARAFRRLKSFAKAVKDYGVLLQLDPKSAEAFRERADCYMDWAHYKEAIQDYTSAIANDADKSKSNFQRRAKAYSMIGEKELEKKDEETYASLELSGKKR